MKVCITILTLFVSATAFSQSVNLDGLKIDVPKDTLLQNAKGRLDSVQTSFYQRSDSLKAIYQARFAKLDSAKSNIQTKLNSVTSLHAPTRKYTFSMDSVNALREKTTASMNEKLQSIKDQTTEKLKALKLPTQLDERISSVTNKIDEFQIPTSDLNTPSFNLSNNPLEKLTDTNLNTLDLGSTGAVKNVAGEASEISSMGTQASGYTKEVQQLTKGDLSEVNGLSEKAEAKALEMSGIKDIESQTQGLEQYKDLAEQAKDPEALDVVHFLPRSRQDTKLHKEPPRTTYTLGIDKYPIPNTQ